MEPIMKVYLKNDAAHNIAQRLLSNQDIYEYLAMLAAFLFSWEEAGVITTDDIHEIYLHAYNQGKEEVETVREMYRRYGIKPEVKGNSGSQLTPAAALEKYFD